MFCLTAAFDAAAAASLALVVDVLLTPVVAMTIPDLLKKANVLYQAQYRPQRKNIELYFSA
jgi:hypothetical protein